MRNSKGGKIASDLLIGIDLSNSLNGGSSEVRTAMTSSEEGYELKVSVPGVDVEKLTVEVVRDRVIVYYMFPVYHQESGSGDQYARVIADYQMPADADYERVSASYTRSHRLLSIVIPFNAHQRGYRSKVEIER
jgi:HSP20 family molecular chaperone IbpA